MLELPDGHEQLTEPVVLVTVFGPFPGQLTNPTELIADEMAGEEHVVCHVLDVSFARSAEEVDRLVRMVDPAAVVCFGVAAEASAIRVETVARNRDDALKPDVDGDGRHGTPIDDGPAELPTRLPVAAILDALAAVDIDTEPSDHAGGYVCNHIFRHVVRMAALAGRPVGFVHVPDPALGHSRVDAESIALAGRIVVDTVAAHARGDI